MKNTPWKLKSKLLIAKDFCANVFFATNKDTIHRVRETDEFTLADTHGGVKTSKSLYILISVILFLSIFLLWASVFSIDEVSKGDGRVIPSSKEKIIQSLDGGILDKIHVTEGQIVQAGDIIANLDTIRNQAAVMESESKYRALLASKFRLLAEISDRPLVFPSELNDFPEITDREMILYTSRKNNYISSIKDIQASKVLLNNELAINTRLMAQGASSKVDVIRIRKQLVDLNMKESELNYNYLVKSGEELSRISGEVDSLSQKIIGQRDLLKKSTITSPVRGIVKNIEVNTIGGVIPPNGTIMNIVPLDDRLLIEAKILPRDIAFIHPGQRAIVKITAYDYSIYGGLDGEVVTISPDTISDPQKPDVVFYRVYIRTTKDHLQTMDNKKHFISPGMVASVDIKTGKKTILQYLIKPFNKVGEALRER
ncbi:HlyD family efflux transporter periplasmic adaptor subunit [Klebsiella aerogenes]|uniref:HlyD family efflux transporter periplasmic adaptor subunit n=1 Tax=Klebsiella aerogenes TaxID=548 RepID=UPI002279A08E|nr:HlyD family efflux transporter periplasmic adaptor subunit [Klebsiella aerogenes]MCY4763722.1 HlyD family efflux transporter periplasmic adaptor subunit [Klebsiella aerogenes]